MPDYHLLHSMVEKTSYCVLAFFSRTEIYLGFFRYFYRLLSGPEPVSTFEKDRAWYIPDDLNILSMQVSFIWNSLTIERYTWIVVCLFVCYL